MTPVLAFDIETIPDVAGLRRLHGLPADLPDRDVAEIAFQLRRTKTGSDFLPLHLHRVVVISCVLRDDEGFKVWSLGTATAKPEIIQRFFDGIEKYMPQLVSWNGGGFDLPVLHYRALIHGVAAPRSGRPGDENRDFRYNNYISRYHTRHLDLMDVLALYQPRNNAPLDDVAQLAGFPGQARHGRLEGVGDLPGGRDREDPQLLRDRHRQHLPAVPALPAAARGYSRKTRTRRKCELLRSYLQEPRQAPLARIPAALE